jgi:cell division protein FtsI (penicillin-binding protein 3)
LKRNKDEADALAQQIVKPSTSENMRSLFRLNTVEGTATKADVIGYRVGGKTGTAEKVIHGHYSADHSLTSFIGAFPMEHPRFSVLVMLDEPKALPETYGFATAGWNAVPTAAKVIERIAPILGVRPEFTAADLEKLAKLDKDKDKKKL